MIEPIRIPTVSQSIPFVDDTGRLTNEAHRRLNEIFAAILKSVNGINDAQGAADDAMGVASAAAPQSRQIIAGNGLGGGGDLSADRTIDMDFPTVTGAYTPTVSPQVNVSAVTSAQATWTRIGDIVAVTGTLTIDPITAGTGTRVSISLPIASNFTAPTNLNGVGACRTVPGQAAALFADVTGDQAFLDYVPPANTNEPMAYNFSYVVLP